MRVSAALIGLYWMPAPAQTLPQTLPQTFVVTPANTTTAVVTRVLDGDTFIALGPDNQSITVRIAAIDAPEKSQAGGDESRQFLTALILKKSVLLTGIKTDVYKRWVANVQLEENGIDVSQAQIRAGMAWVFERYLAEQAADKRELYRSAQKQARAERLGIWKDIDNAFPVAPWQFRRGVIN